MVCILFHLSVLPVIFDFASNVLARCSMHRLRISKQFLVVRATGPRTTKMAFGRLRILQHS